MGLDPVPQHARGLSATKSAVAIRRALLLGPMLGPLAVSVGLSVVAPVSQARADAPDCALLEPIAAPGLGWTEVALPDQPDGVSLTIVLDAGFGPLALPLRQTGADSATFLMPLSADPAGTATQAIIAAEAADGSLVWLCEEVATDILPLPPRPGGTLRMAGRFEAMTDDFLPTLAVLADDATAQGLADLLPGLAADLRLLAQDLDAADLAQVDDVLGAYTAALEVATPGLFSGAGTGATPDATPGRLWAPPAPTLQRPRTPWSFQRGTAALPGFPGGPDPFGAKPAHRQAPLAADLGNVCPADLSELTDYIRIGTLARAHTTPTSQFLLTTGITLAGLSGRLVNAATGRSERIDSAIDKSVIALNTTQAVIGDYLAGMMPLNLDRLEVRHTDATFFDDTPYQFRQLSVTHVSLSTRSDGWSPDKAALDVLIAIASTRSTGSLGGLVSNQSTASARRVATEMAEHATAMRQNADRMQRIATTVERQFGTELNVTRSTINTTRALADNASSMARMAENTARAAREAERRASDLALGIGTGVGVPEGLATGQATTAIGNSDLAVIGVQVSRCSVPLWSPGSGGSPRFMFLAVEGGDNTVVVPTFSPPLTLEVIGNGRAVGILSLNPVADAFPLPGDRPLPEARIPVFVEEIDIDIIGAGGPGGAVAAGADLVIEATVDGVLNTPFLEWSVEPDMGLARIRTDGSQIRLSIPDDLPEETLITLTAAAPGDYISSATRLPQETVVMVVREPEEEPEEEEEPTPMSCGQMLADLERPYTLLSGQSLLGDWRSIANATLAPANHVRGCFREFQIDDRGRVLTIPDDPDGLSVSGGYSVVWGIPGSPAGLAPDSPGIPLARIEQDVFWNFLGGPNPFLAETYGTDWPRQVLSNSCFTAPGFTDLGNWINAPGTEVFVALPGFGDHRDCNTFFITDGDYMLEAGNLSIDWHAVMYTRDSAPR